VIGNRAFVADRAGASGTGGFAVIDVSDPTRPGLISSAATAGFAEGLDVLGDKVFVAAAYAGMAVFDAANPLAPTQIAQFDTPGDAENVTLAGTRAYVSDYNRGLQIVDVLNPAAPVKLGELSTSGDAFNIQIVSNRAYVATGIGRAQVVDVDNASAPALISTSLAGKSVHSLQIIGQHAFLADRESGLLVAELLGFSPVAPSIVEFPTNISATAGRELVLSVAAEGTPPLSYAWQLNGTPLTNPTNITGVNQPHLSFTNLLATNRCNPSARPWRAGCLTRRGRRGRPPFLATSRSSRMAERSCGWRICVMSVIPLRSATTRRPESFTESPCKQISCSSPSAQTESRLWT
jgi:hypothetical protein